MPAATPAMINACSTVRSVVGEALQAAAKMLGAGDAGAAQSQWQAAHAALRVVNHKGLVQFSQELGALIAPGLDAAEPAATQAFSDGVAALLAYMDHIIAGHRDQSLRLLPAYREVLRARGVEQVSDTDLFFPDLDAGPGDNVAAMAMDSEALRATRRKLEAGLLMWLRKADDPSGLQQVRDAVGSVEAAQTSSCDRALWWVAGAVLEAVAQGGLAADNPVRRFVTQLNMHLGRMVQGPSAAPDTLMRDALYLAARANPVTTLVETVQKTCGLQGALEIEDEVIAGFSGEAIAAARRDAEGLQDLWSACAGVPEAPGAAGATGDLNEFARRLNALEKSSQALGQPAFSAVVTQLADNARTLGASAQGMSEVAALEGATALLLIEQVLARDAAPDAGFADRACNIAARLKISVEAPASLSALPPPQLLDEATREAREKALVSLVHDEVARGLQGVEDALERWFRDPAKTDIRPFDKPMAQAAGALIVMGHVDAAAIMLQCRGDIARYAEGETCEPEAQQLLVKRLTALSAFIQEARQRAASLADVMARMGLPAPQPVVAKPEASPPVADLAPSLVPSVSSSAPTPASAAPDVAPAPEPMAVAEPAENIDGGGDTDPDMLEIFLEEASEVLGTISTTAPESRGQPQDQELLTTLRRAFHTLKGSGRMIGLKHLGEAAWEMEQVFNEMAAAKQPGTPDLYRLVEYAHGKFSHWIADLRAQKQIGIDAVQLVDWAKKVRAHEPLPPEATADVPQESLATQRSTTPSPEPVTPDDTVHVGDIRVSGQLYEIFLPEAQSHAAALVEHDRRMRGGAKVDLEFLRAVHTLTGISGTSGFPMVRSVGASLERLLQAVMNHDAMPRPAACELIARAVSTLNGQVVQIAARIKPAEHAELVADLDAMTPLVGITPKAPMDSATGIPEAVVESTAGESAVPVIEVITPPTEMPMEPALATMDFTAGPVAAVAPPSPAPATMSTPGATPIPRVPDDGNTISLVASKNVDAGVERRSPRVSDDVDSQLLPIFLEEAQELVPQVGQDLRDWRARPDDKLVPQSLKRLLHTLKGSARMAGAMALGQLTHSMETRVENAALLPSIPGTLFDNLEASFDRIGVLIEKLQGKETSGDVEAVSAAAEHVALPEAMDQMAKSMRMDTAMMEIPAQPTGAAPAPGAAPTESVVSVQRPLIRVRADLIDRLANQAGEISITRARVSAELRSARATLRDLTENIGRLRTQLREMEIQAETQMQSRFSVSPEQADGKFDPLEFDRFTRLQELTRLMAESVNDVATVQQNLSRDLDEGEKALSAQAQMTRDVQQDLMAIRMVPFNSLTDRLYRVTRLAAKDSGKRVQLDIKGGHVELDRGVLDRISAPLEHLLRNAIAHGIEAPEGRREAGKAEAGELLIEVRQEGNEVVLVMSDDGAGLNIKRIREKAISLALMRPDEMLTDQQIGNFIFRSGFSTAGTVTAVAGRGVGMDVVMSEITALGGRVGTAFVHGKGTTFAIHLPLTLSVLQGVVFRLGGNLYAVPTMMVEQLQRPKMDVLAAAQGAGMIEWQGKQYPFHQLRDLMELPPDGEEPTRFGSVLLLRGGSHRVGIRVDDIVGGQEIVIKNIGPQLARVPGVTGAAVLGSGETVLILNPVQLALRAEEKARNAPVHAAPGVPAAPAAPVAAVPARQRIVLVVDDSLTVRKITGRLLSREGYNVVVAKDGVEALEKLQEQRPDVMITDVEMPRMDGFDLTKNVREDASLKGLPIIMITSRTADKHREHATELGVDVFLGKPYEESELLQHIAALAARPVSVEATPVSMVAAPATPVAAAVPVSAAPVRPSMILVVDDSLTVRKITGRLLSREGYNVVVAKDGVEALEKLQEQRPDVMITDVEMPRMDGFELTKNVREDASLKGLPIIMITSRTADKHREHATELGVDVFLGKPYAESDLLGHIKTLAARPLVA